MVKQFKFFALLYLLAMPYTTLYFLLRAEKSALYWRSRYLNREYWEIQEIDNAITRLDDYLALPAA